MKSNIDFEDFESSKLFLYQVVKKECMIMIHGPSQSAKFNWINSIAGKYLTSDQSNSDKQGIKLYSFENDNEEYHILDLPGYDDTDSLLSDEGINIKTRLHIVGQEKSTQMDTLDGIIIFEELSNESTQLQSTLANMGKMLDISFKKSTIVMVANSYEASLDEQIARFEQVQDICRQQGVVAMNWQNNPQDQFSKQEQIQNLRDELKKIIKLVHKYRLANIQQIRSKVKEIATYLRSQNNIKTQTIQMVQQQRVKKERFEKVAGIRQRKRIMPRFKTIENFVLTAYLGGIAICGAIQVSQDLAMLSGIGTVVVLPFVVLVSAVQDGASVVDYVFPGNEEYTHEVVKEYSVLEYVNINESVGVVSRYIDYIPQAFVIYEQEIRDKFKK